MSVIIFYYIIISLGMLETSNYFLKNESAATILRVPLWMKYYQTIVVLLTTDIEKRNISLSKHVTSHHCKKKKSLIFFTEASVS